MASAEWLLATILVVLLFVRSEGTSSEPIKYIVSVINYLAASESGVPSCVFYRFVKNTSLEPVLRAPELEFVSKVIFLTYAPIVRIDQWSTEKMLIVLEANQLSKRFNHYYFNNVMESMSPKTKILVLADTESKDFHKCDEILRNLNYCDVVYLDEKNHRMWAVDIVKRVQLKYLGAPSEVFNGSMIRNMRGRRLKIAGRIKVLNDTPFYVWSKETALLMNTTVWKTYHTCGIMATDISNPCYDRHLDTKRIDIDLTCYTIDNYNKFAFNRLLTSLMYYETVLVPRSQLTIVQLFFFPFQLGVWVLLGSLLGLAEILKLLFPWLLRNDPILLVVCGFERYDLHKARRWEKIVLLSLIVLIFFTTCAYETKLQSMMIRKPATRQINTLQELIDSGIKIKVNLLSYPSLINHSLIDGIVVDSLETVIDMDMEHAYIATQNVAEFVASFYYDSSQRMFRYRVLREPLSMNHLTINLSSRSPFLNILSKTLSSIIESGLYEHWQMIRASSHRLRIAKTVDALFFSDITPAWMAWGGGLIVSIVAFVGEICIKVLVPKLWSIIFFYKIKRSQMVRNHVANLVDSNKKKIKR
ncbi:uncharacterized protein LOC128093718 [Culex pipiens pallens]|uniref:uncharacterized protein LOC128093718 n=1 Tax=Culex pipiens pallens TaxID=42434 RepID=UPI0022AA5413|nr:uncharacterized protein LOC128093718 [Culex pipiens pallens]